jgi:conjugal transfer pilin signal peptidase TrbI
VRLADMMRTPRRVRVALAAGLTLSAAGLGAIATWRDEHALLINATTSLPNWAFVLHRTQTPQRGDIIFFVPPESALLARHFGPELHSFGKIVVGAPGDRITTSDRTFLIDGRPVATAKTASRRGEPLALGPTGILPPGCYFVATPHPDSFDSRYAAIGWVCRPRILGVGRAIL